jgi:Peptidase A4 family
MAARRPATPGVGVRTVAGTLKVRTYEPPAADFDPRTATARELLHHGFPSRPDAKASPELRERWDRAFERPMIWIVPEFREVPGKSHGPAQKPRPPRVAPRTPSAAAGAGAPAAAGVLNATSGNWSGSVAFPPQGQTFRWVEGQWTVPNPYTQTDGSYYASEWVGIDGWNSPDVLQAGTETEITKIWFITQRNVYAWWEWYPAGEVAVTNLPVSPGDVMSCLICVNSATTATVYYSNRSNGVSTTFTITAPRGTTLQGNCAEWIVERPGVGGGTASLADYDVVYFDGSVAGSAGPNVIGVTDLGSGTPVTMVGNQNASLSVPTFETATLMKVNWLKSS